MGIDVKADISMLLTIFLLSLLVCFLVPTCNSCLLADPIFHGPSSTCLLTPVNGLHALCYLLLSSLEATECIKAEVFHHTAAAVFHTCNEHIHATFD